jgi:hypothetical protein
MSMIAPPGTPRLRVPAVFANESLDLYRKPMLEKAGIIALFLALWFLLGSFRVAPESAWLLPERGVRVQGELMPSPQPYRLDMKYAQWVINYRDESNVIPVWMACRLFGLESRGDPESGDWDEEAVSWAFAMGLAQIIRANCENPDFYTRYNDGKPIDPFDPETAIRVGIRLLADLYLTTGSYQIALMSYYSGLGHFTRPRDCGPFGANSYQYAARILGK